MRVMRGPLALVLASMLLALAGTGLAIAAVLASSATAANQAVTDQAATRQVAAVVSTDVAAVFSYSFTDLAATQQAAKRMLAGQAAAQYQEIFPVLSNARAQQLTVTSRVIRAGVLQLSGNDAKVLVFMNQKAARAHAKAATARAQLVITAQRRDGRWLITGIQAR